ncbi:MAG TPA: hypothetical protein VIT90_10630 [Lysobacter sp.]
MVLIEMIAFYAIRSGTESRMAEAKLLPKAGAIGLRADGEWDVLRG